MFLFRGIGPVLSHKIVERKDSFLQGCGSLILHIAGRMNFREQVSEFFLNFTYKIPHVDIKQFKVGLFGEGRTSLLNLVLVFPYSFCILLHLSYPAFSPNLIFFSRIQSAYVY